MRFGGALGRRYGRAKGKGGKRSEGVKVDRDPKRIYYVTKGGQVMSVPRKNA